MSITIHIHLLNGDVLPFTARARQGRVKYETVKGRMSEMVLDHLQLPSDNYRVVFVHDHDEKLLEEQWIAGRPNCLSSVSFAEQVKKQPELEQHYQSKVDNVRRYQNGDIIHAVVEELNLRRLWADLEDSDMEDAE